MKKIIITLSILLFALQAFAQSPYKISYQAVIRDAANGLVANTEVGTQISILQGSMTGTAVFVETHTDTTNDNGLLSLEIGGGTNVSGSMEDIDWSAGPYFIQTETDPTGGTNYSITGVSQLASVPFAFQAINADTSQFARKAGEAITALEADNAAISVFADSTNKAAFAYNFPVQKRSIVYTPGMVNSINMGGGAVHARLPGSLNPVIDLPEGGGFVEFFISVPLPRDYKGTNIQARVLYTSTTNTGDFDLVVGVKPTKLDGDLTPFLTGFTPPFGPPSSPNFLTEGVDNVGVFSIDTRVLTLLFRRNSQSANDTSTGTMRILGVTLEYDN